MANIDLYPLQDNYESKLSQPYDGTSSVIYVDSIPTGTIPVGYKVLVTINPWTSFAQVVEVNGWSSWQLNVSSTTIEKANGANYTTRTHWAKSPIIISDNFAYWKEIATVVNTKADTDNPTFTTMITWPVYADLAALTTAYPTPTNGMQSAYCTLEWQYYDAQWGSRQPRANGSNPNASETVAGKVEKATQWEANAWTSTGWTGAELFVWPAELKVITDWLVTPDASETVKGKVELATDAEWKTGTDTTRVMTVNTTRLVLWEIIPWTAITYWAADTERTSSLTSMTKVKEILMNNSWNYTVSFDLKASVWWASTVNARIYLNWVATWTNRTSSSTTYVSYSENFQLKYWDLIQLYYQSVSGTHAIIRNFRVTYNATTNTDWTINLD